jgi:hypothetical protein
MFKSHAIIEVNSKSRDTGTIEDMLIRLSHQIKFSQSPSKSYWMRMENTLIPKTFYDINSSNNVFIVLEEDGAAGYDTLSVTIEPGNYTITELLTQLEADLDANTNNGNSYTLLYDDILNKVSFEYVDNGGGTPSADVIIDTIANGSTLNDPLGWGRTDLVDATTTFLTTISQNAPYGVDLDTVSYIMVDTDITSNNYYDKNQQKHIGALIPFNVDRNDKQYHENDGGHLTLMNSKGPISSIRLRLHKEDTRDLVDLNGINWSTTIAIYELTDRAKL